MVHTLFISDLHLTADRPHSTQQFLHFIEHIAPGAEALYILGDLFEYWVGDDDTEDPLNTAVATSLAQLAKRGTAVYLLHGNRDLLIGQAFAARCNASIIHDPTLINLYGTRTLLMHGDTLCTDDVEYQKFRDYAHNAETQLRFLQQPLAARHQQMRAMRAKSEASKSTKATEIMNVSLDTLGQVLRKYDFPRLIHGHTHMPALHIHVTDGNEIERWVLSDWYGGGSYLRCDNIGCAAVNL